MKNLTKVAVLLTAIEMMKDQGTATTLEVKEALRAEGYFAKQADVSNFMFECAQEEGWAIDNSGTYRTYSIDANHVAAAIPVVAQANNDGLRSYGIKHRDGSEVDVTEKEEGTEVTGDWVVESDSELPMLFDQIYTRDEVRGAYAKLNDVKFVEVRASKIK